MIALWIYLAIATLMTYLFYLLFSFGDSFSSSFDDNFDIKTTTKKTIACVLYGVFWIISIPIMIWIVFKG